MIHSLPVTPMDHWPGKCGGYLYTVKIGHESIRRRYGSDEEKGPGIHTGGVTPFRISALIEAEQRRRWPGLCATDGSITLSEGSFVRVSVGPL